MTLFIPPFWNIPPGYAEFIMADPPWRFEHYSERGHSKSAANHYATMSLADIKALPVGDIAAENALLFLWATWPMIYQALAVCETWGFTYKSGGVWNKRTKNGLNAFGTGYLLRSSCEPFLIATRGQITHSRSHRNQFDGLAREHSRKPEAAYTWCESYMPDARRVELFARTRRAGWLAWGDETERFAAS
jgi:N6-adenosine-specific RNA methylase IME4